MIIKKTLLNDSELILPNFLEVTIQNIEKVKKLQKQVVSEQLHSISLLVSEYRVAYCFGDRPNFDYKCEYEINALVLVIRDGFFFFKLLFENISDTVETDIILIDELNECSRTVS